MPSSPRAWAAIVAAGMLFAAPAAAQKGEPPPPPPDLPPPPAPPAPPAPQRARPPRPGPAPRAIPPRTKRGWVPRAKRGHRDVVFTPGMPIASFPGFARLDDGKSRIFIEVSTKVDVAEKKEPNRVVYRLRGTSVMQRTNELPLLTGFFSTPVDRVQLVQDGADLNVVIELREPTEVTSRVIETPRGMVLWIDFPKSVNFDRQDRDRDDVAVDRPAAKRSTTTQRIGGQAGPGGEDLPPPPVQGD